MNGFTVRAQRKEATAILLKNEIDMLLNQGYNPITNTFQIPDNDAILPGTLK